MIVLFGSVVLLSVNVSQGMQSSTLHAFFGIVLAVLLSIPFTLKTYVVREYTGPALYPLWDFNRDATILESLIYTVALLCLLDYSALKSSDFVFGSLGFVTEYFGKQFKCKAVKEGLAGPATSLQSVQPVYSVLLGVLIL